MITFSKTSLAVMLLAVILLVFAGCLLLFSNVHHPLITGAEAMSVSDESSGSTRLKIEATLGKKSFALGQRVQLVLWVTNQEKELVTVADPRRGGDSLRLSLRLPDGEERSFTTGEALRAPGVKQILVGMRVPPGVRQNFEFDLAKLVTLDQPGRYLLKLEYTWKAGEQAWHSAEMPFSIAAPTRSRARPTAKKKSLKNIVETR